jgi:beta-lactamase superfamily II metal-dependent hydrolase
VTGAYLDALRPAWVTTSVGSANGYHHMHDQAKAVYRARGIPWYRTDRNGTIEIRSPGVGSAKFSITVRRGTSSMNGRSDERSAQLQCNPIP